MKIPHLTYITYTISFTPRGILSLKHLCGSICTSLHVWGLQLQTFESQLGKLHFDPGRSAQKQHRSAFLCALLSYTGNISLVPVWQVPLWTLTTNARSARHAVLADHLSSILTLLPHKKVAAALGPDQASLAVAWCRDLAEGGLYVRDSWHHRDNGLYKWRVDF